jgi:hypothetical protein
MALTAARALFLSCAFHVIIATSGYWVGFAWRWLTPWFESLIVLLGKVVAAALFLAVWSYFPAAPSKHSAVSHFQLSGMMESTPALFGVAVAVSCFTVLFLFWWCRARIYGGPIRNPHEQKKTGADKNSKNNNFAQQEDSKTEAAVLLTEAAVAKLLQNIGFSAKLDTLREDLTELKSYITSLQTNIQLAIPTKSALGEETIVLAIEQTRDELKGQIYEAQREFHEINGEVLCCITEALRREDRPSKRFAVENFVVVDFQPQEFESTTTKWRVLPSARRDSESWGDASSSEESDGLVCAATFPTTNKKRTKKKTNTRVKKVIPALAEKADPVLEKLKGASLQEAEAIISKEVKERRAAARAPVYLTPEEQEMTYQELAHRWAILEGRRPALFYTSLEKLTDQQKKWTKSQVRALINADKHRAWVAFLRERGVEISRCASCGDLCTNEHRCWKLEWRGREKLRAGVPVREEYVIRQKGPSINMRRQNAVIVDELSNKLETLQRTKDRILQLDRDYPIFKPPVEPPLAVTENIDKPQTEDGLTKATPDQGIGNITEGLDVPMNEEMSTFRKRANNSVGQ